MSQVDFGSLSSRGKTWLARKKKENKLTREYVSVFLGRCLFFQSSGNILKFKAPSNASIESTLHTGVINFEKMTQFRINHVGRYAHTVLVYILSHPCRLNKRKNIAPSRKLAFSRTSSKLYKCRALRRYHSKRVQIPVIARQF